MTPYGQHQLQSTVHGAVVDELTVDDCKRILIPDAPIEVQDEIGDKVLEAFENKWKANLLEGTAIKTLESRHGSEQHPSGASINLAHH